MKIIDVNGTEREIKSIKKITHNRINNSTAYKNINVDGELKTIGELQITEVDEKYVEVIIIGLNGREWTEWYPLEKFERMNPNLEVN